MIKIFVFLLFIAAIFSAGCDPVRRIDMINETGDSAEIIWTLAELEDARELNPFMISSSHELKFSLHSAKTNKIKMSFGEGSWTPKEVEKLVANLESLEIISRSQRIRIDSLPLLKEFLLARRKGLGGARIEIAVSKQP